MAQDRESRVTLRWLIDQASLNRVKSASDTVEQRLGDVGKTAGRTGVDIRRAFADSEKAAGKLTERLEQVKRKTEELAKIQAGRGNFDKLRNELTSGWATRSAGGGVLTNTIGQGSTALSGLASVGFGPGAQLGGDILGAVEGLSKLKGELKGLSESLVSAGGLTGKLASSIGGAGTLGVAAIAGAAAIAVLAVGIDNFNKIVGPAASTLERATATIKTYYDAITDGTSSTISKQIEELRKQKARADAEIKAIQDSIAKADRAALQAGGLHAVAAGVKNLDPRFQALNTRLNDLIKQSNDAEGSITGLQAALDHAAVKARDAEEAEKKLAEARVTAIEKTAQEEIELAKLARAATRQQVQNQIDDLKDEAAGIANAYSKALEKNDEASKKLAEKLKAQYQELQDKIANREALLPLIDARAQEDRQIRQTTEALKDLRDTRKQQTEDEIAGRKREITESDRLAEEEITNENERNRELARLAEKYDSDIRDIEESSLQKRANIQKSYNDELVKIAKGAADAAADALRKLEQQRADLARDLARDEQRAQRDAAARELNIRIDAAREDERAFRDHQRNLERIRREAQDREFELIMNRDFAGLFFSRRQTTQALQGETAQFTAERQERQIGQQQQLDDLQRSIARERQERLIAYQQNLADAQAAYQRERAEIERQRIQALAEARANRQRELAELQTSIRQQLEARRRGYMEELKLAIMTARERQKIEEEFLARARAMLTASAAPVRRASGGDLAAFQLAAVNEPGSSGRESFSSGGRNYPFPGPGFFFPTQPGAVNANPGVASNNITVAPVFNITGGSNPQATAQAIEPMVYKVVKRIVGVA